jgi:hypothetical protein
MRCLKLFLAAMLIAWGTTAFPAVAQSPVWEGPGLTEVHTAKRVKALLIGMTDDKAIGEGCTANIHAMELYVRGLPNFDPKKDLVVLQGKDATAEKIMEAVEKIKVQPGEVVFCYITGHGVYDGELPVNRDKLDLDFPDPLNDRADDPSGGHVFQLPGKDLKRKVLLDALKAKGGQLTVLISDTCNVPRAGLPEAPKIPTEPDVLKELLDDAPTVKPEQREEVDFGLLPKKKEPVHSRAFEELLFQHEGVVDVSGSSRDQYGWFNPDGGWFTIGLLKTLDDYAAEEGQGEGGQLEAAPYHWTLVLERTAETASAIFHGRKNLILKLPAPTEEDAKAARRKLAAQEGQFPQVFEMNVVYNAR